MHSMYKPAPKKDIFDLRQNTLDQFAESKIEVAVSSKDGVENKTIAQLVKAAKEKNKAIIFTFTPGPFKDNSELPENWMNIDKAKGCSNQLTTLNNEFAKLDAVVYAVNKHPSAYQALDNGLIAKKQLNNIKMISDADNKLEQAFHLPTLEIPDPRYQNSRYFERFSIIFAPNGLRNIIKLESPVDAEKAQAHVNEINTFINVFRCGLGKT